MTNRERMLRVFRGGELDRIPFVHVNNLAAPNTEIWDMLGKENIALSRWSSINTHVQQNCKLVTERIVKNGAEGVRNTIYTPKGSLYEELFPIPGYGCMAKTKYFVTEEEDYPILMEFLQDRKEVPAPEIYLNHTKEMGDDGLVYACLHRTPYARMWIDYVSIEDLAIHMVDCPELVEECFDIMGSQLRQTFDMIVGMSKEFDIPIINIPENITAPLIGGEKYRKYCMPYYTELKEKLQDANISVVTHLDGDLKAIRNEVGQADIDGIDSFTPPPTADTSVGEALALWPHMRIMCNFPSSVHVYPQEEIYETAKEILRQGGHSGRMWIQISENVPDGVWKNSFPAILQAIDEFGKP